MMVDGVVVLVDVEEEVLGLAWGAILEDDEDDALGI